MDKEVQDDNEDASSAQRPVLPSLDFSALRGEEAEPTQQKLQAQQEQPDKRGVTKPSRLNKQGNARAQKLRLARLSRLDGCTKAKVSRSVQTAHVKSWLHAHGYVVKADKLHPAVTRVIAEWFQLVDEDGSRTLEHHELLAALKAAKIPCDDATINEMIDMMDMNRDGVIGWDEFEVFMTEEFAAGKSLLSGEYLLPSGLSINFGVMIGKLKRDRLLGDVMEDKRRNKWADLARNPDALGRELATMQEAAEAAHLAAERVKRAEQVDERAATPRKQLTAALLRAIEHSRKLTRSHRQLTAALRPASDTVDGAAFQQALGADPSAQTLASQVPPADDAPVTGLNWDLSSGRGALPSSSRADSPGPPSQTGMVAPPPPGLALRRSERGTAPASTVAGSAAFAAASMIKAQEPPTGTAAVARPDGFRDPSPTPGAGSPTSPSNRLLGNVAGVSSGRVSPGAGRFARVPGEVLPPSARAMSHTASSLLHRRHVTRTMSCVAEMAEGLRGSGRGMAPTGRCASGAGDPSPPPPPLAVEISLPVLPSQSSVGALLSGHAGASSPPPAAPMPLHQHYLRAPGHPQHLQLRRPSRISLHAEHSSPQLSSPSPSAPPPPLAPVLSLPDVHRPPSAASRPAPTAAAAAAAAAVPFAAPLPPLASVFAHPPVAGGAGAGGGGAGAQQPSTPRVYSHRMLPILPDHTLLSAFVDSAVAVARAEVMGRNVSTGSGASVRRDTVEGISALPLHAYSSVAVPQRATAPGLVYAHGGASSSAAAAHSRLAGSQAQSHYTAAGTGAGSFTTTYGVHHSVPSHAAGYTSPASTYYNSSQQQPQPNPYSHNHGPSPGPNYPNSLPRDPVALLTERKAVVRAATASLTGMSPAAAPRGSPTASAGPGTDRSSAPPDPGSAASPPRAANPAVDADAAEWISYTRVPATTVGPTPLAAPSTHAHYSSRTGTPVPPPLPPPPPGGAHISGIGSVAELGATATVIAVAQAQAQVAADRPPSSLGMAPPQGDPHAAPAHPHGAPAPQGASGNGSGVSGAGDGALVHSTHSIGPQRRTPPSPHPAGGRAEGRSSQRPPSEQQPQQPPDQQKPHGGLADVHEADDEVARLLSDGNGWSAWLERNRPDPQNGPEVLLRGPCGQPLEELEEKWARAPVSETLLQELSTHNIAVTADGTAIRLDVGGNSRSGGGGRHDAHEAAAAAAMLGRWHAPSHTASGIGGSSMGPGAGGASFQHSTRSLGAESSSAWGSGAGAHSAAHGSDAYASGSGAYGAGARNFHAAASSNTHAAGRSVSNGSAALARGQGGGGASRPGSRLGGRSTSPSIWQDCRPPSRLRGQLAVRVEKENPIELSWRAAAASLLQLRLSKQLYDLEARRI